MVSSTFEVLKGGFTVQNDRGIHTRPASELVKAAARFQSEITLIHKKMRVNAKSLLGILMLCLAKGAKVKIEARGPDAALALESLKDLAASKFNIEY
jgi:phosphocarrier protein HPr